MKKKIFSVILAAVMTLNSSAAVFATDMGAPSVNTEPIPMLTASNANSAAVYDFTNQSTPAQGTGYSWNQGSNTLTLTNFTYTGETGSPVIKLPANSVIIIQGNNSIRRTSSNGPLLSSVGDITIQGDGKLELYQYTAIVQAQSLTIESGEVLAYFGDNNRTLFSNVNGDAMPLHLKGGIFATNSSSSSLAMQCVGGIFINSRGWGSGFPQGAENSLIFVDATFNENGIVSLGEGSFYSGFKLNSKITLNQGDSIVSTGRDETPGEKVTLKFGQNGQVNLNGGYVEMSGLTKDNIYDYENKIVGNGRICDDQLRATLSVEVKNNQLMLPEVNFSISRIEATENSATIHFETNAEKIYYLRDYLISNGDTLSQRDLQKAIKSAFTNQKDPPTGGQVTVNGAKNFTIGGLQPANRNDIKQYSFTYYIMAEKEGFPSNVIKKTITLQKPVIDTEAVKGMYQLKNRGQEITANPQLEYPLLLTFDNRNGAAYQVKLRGKKLPDGAIEDVPYDSEKRAYVLNPGQYELYFSIPEDGLIGEGYPAVHKAVEDAPLGITLTVTKGRLKTTQFKLQQINDIPYDNQIHQPGFKIIADGKEVTASEYGTMEVEYYRLTENEEKIPVAEPKNVGIYYAAPKTKGSEYYEAFELPEGHKNDFSFKIVIPNDGNQITEFNVPDVTYGDYMSPGYSKHTCKSAYGDCSIKYFNSSKEPLNSVPTEPGTYYAQAISPSGVITIDGNPFYYNEAVSELKEFTIKKFRLRVDMNVSNVQSREYDGTTACTGAQMSIHASSIKPDSLELPVVIADLEWESKDAGCYTIVARNFEYPKEHFEIINLNKNQEYSEITTGGAKINPRTAEIVWGDTTLTYNGKSQVPQAEVKNLVPGDTCQVTVSGGQTDVTARARVTAESLSNGNYILPKTKPTASFGIQAKPLTIKNATLTARDYDPNQSTADVAAVTFNESAPVPAFGSGVTATAVLKENGAGSKAATVTVTLTDGNYSLAVNTIESTVTITQATYDGDKTATGAAKYGNTGKVDLTALLCDGAQIGSITKSDGETIITGTPEVTGKELTYTLADIPGNAAKTATIAVPVTSVNYKDYTITVTITVNDKDKQANLTITSLTGTYGETLTLTTEGGSGSGAVSFTIVSDGSTGAGSIEGDKLTIAKAGTIKIKATKAADDDYAAVDSAIADVVIAKAKPTGTPAFTKITTFGKTLKDAPISVGSITPAGTIKWNDADSTEVEANKSYGWTFTPTDVDNYETLTGTLEVYRVAPYVPPVMPTEPEVKPEIGENNDVTVDTPDKETAEMDKDVLDQIFDKVDVQKPDATLKVETKEGTVEYDNKALEVISKETENAKSISVTVKETVSNKENMTPQQQEEMEQIQKNPENTVFSITLEVTKKDGSKTELHNFGGGKATITVSYKAPDEGKVLKVYRLEADGSRTPVKSFFDALTGKLSWITPSHSYYVVTTEDAPELAEGWNLDEFGWFFVQNGQKLTDSWAQDSKGWCYLGEDGYVVTETWKADSHGWCWLDENGRQAFNRWAKDSIDWCYVDGTGYLVTNRWQADSHGWLYIGSDGRILRNGWAQDSVDWCYLDTNGYLLKSGWAQDSKGWCYVSEDGRLLRDGYAFDSLGKHYIDKDGHMVQ